MNNKSIYEVEFRQYQPSYYDIDEMIDELDNYWVGLSNPIPVHNYPSSELITKLNQTNHKEKINMVQLNQTYVTEEEKPTGGNSVHVPDGVYKAVVISSELSKSPYNDADPQGLLLKVVITEGEHADTEFEHYLAIADDRPVSPSHPTFLRSKAAVQTLAQIADALGIPSFNDTALFHNKPLMINTKTTKGMDKNVTPPVHKPEWDKSFIKSYSAVPSVGIEGQAQAFTPPTSQAPAQAPVEQPVTATVAPDANATPPWAQG